MTARDKNALLSQSQALFPDQTTKDITPARKRTYDADIIDSTLNNTEASLQTVAGPVNFTGGLQVGGENIQAYDGLTTILFGSSNTTQGPTATDTIHQITYGAAQGTPGVDEAALEADGTLTLRDVGLYWLRYVHTFGRTGSSGTATLFARTVVNGVQFSDSAEVRIDSADTVIPFEYSFPFTTTTANTEVTVEFYRSSTGSNSGDLISETPNLAGWNDTNAASVLVARLK